LPWECVGDKFRSQQITTKPNPPKDGDGLVVGVEEEDEKLKTKDARLLQNHPNPINPSTTI